MEEKFVGTTEIDVAFPPRVIEIVVVVVVMLVEEGVAFVGTRMMDDASVVDEGDSVDVSDVAVVTLLFPTPPPP